MHSNKGIFTYPGVHIMATFTTTQYGNTSGNAGKTKFTIAAFIDALFAVKLREELDAKTGGDKSDAAYTWGL